ncbi:MAG: hypothetical protein R3D56_04150 [Paracoccaceae bacterium]
MSPAYFPGTVASPIVSLAANQTGHSVVARTLFVIAGLAYLILWWLTIPRLRRHPRLMLADVSDHPGFFTLIAASSILGSECVILLQMTTAVLFWYTALGLWLGLTYAIFTLLSRSRP